MSKNQPKIALTRPLGQNNETAILAYQLGFQTATYPLVQLKPMSNLEYDIIIGELTKKFKAIVFTSKNGVKFLNQYLTTKNKPLVDVIGSKICFAIGSTTANLLRQLRISPKVPNIFTSVHLADLIIDYHRKIPCSPIAVLRTSVAIGRPPTSLLQEAMIDVNEFVVYETKPNSPKVIDSLIIDLQNDQLSAIIFTSPFAEDTLFSSNCFTIKEIRALLQRSFICSIGPLTSNCLKKYNVHIDLQSKIASVNHRLNELKVAMSKKPSSNHI